MKLREEFEVAKPTASVWSFFEQPEQVAGCVPGIEEVSVVGPDDIEARLTQSVGPMTATFAGSVQITERVAEKRMSFTATGKSVRGASGNVRATVEVSLEQLDERTLVAVDAEVILAGPLGSVGQKVVAKQAGKVTAAFSRNLAQALGATTATTTTSPTAATTARPMKPASPTERPGPTAQERWAKVAAALAAASLGVSAVHLVRDLRRGAR